MLGGALRESSALCESGPLGARFIGR